MLSRWRGIPPLGDEMADLDKKALSEKQRDFQLHIALVMKQDSIPKAKAVFACWLEGETGLARRLGQKELSL